MLVFENGYSIVAEQLIITVGSSEKIWKLIHSMGHTIVAPVPSLFTFNISDPRLIGFAGAVSYTHLTIKYRRTRLIRRAKTLQFISMGDTCPWWNFY